jgi:hypothetical protein
LCEEGAKESRRGQREGGRERGAQTGPEAIKISSNREDGKGEESGRGRERREEGVIYFLSKESL